MCSSKDHFPRNDYRELTEITLLLLEEIPQSGAHWLKPSEFHSARWVGNALYAGQLFTFSEQINLDDNHY